MSKSYSDLILLPTFIERFRYLKLDGVVGQPTFGFDRYLNQQFYRSDPEWKAFRRDIIIRDEGRDLAMPGHELGEKYILIHHIDPIDSDDIRRRTSKLFDPENVISMSFRTHRAIHYGDESQLIIAPIERTKNDTCPWKK